MSDKEKDKKKKEAPTNEIRKEYEDYFNEVLEELDETQEKMKSYLEIVDEQIEQFRSIPQKSGSKYLVENVKNAAEIVGQLQGLTKEKFNVRKTILDFERKERSGEVSNDDLVEILRQQSQAIVQANKKADSSYERALRLNEESKDIESEIEKRIRELEEEEES